MKSLLNIPLSLLWGIFILILTLLPGTMFPDTPDFLSLFQPDKIIHLVLFAVFMFLLTRDIKNKDSRILKKRPFLSAMLIAVTLGLITEMLQHYLIQGRVGSPYDFIANFTGCLIGRFTYFFAFSRK